MSRTTQEALCLIHFHFSSDFNADFNRYPTKSAFNNWVFLVIVCYSHENSRSTLLPTPSFPQLPRSPRDFAVTAPLSSAAPPRRRHLQGGPEGPHGCSEALRAARPGSRASEDWQWPGASGGWSRSKVKSLGEMSGGLGGRSGVQVRGPLDSF